MKPKVTPDKASYNKGEIDLPSNKGLDQRTNPQMAARGYSYEMLNVDPMPDGSFRVRESLNATAIGSASYIVDMLNQQHPEFPDTAQIAAMAAAGDYLVLRLLTDIGCFFVTQKFSDPSVVKLCRPNNTPLTYSTRWRQQYVTFEEVEGGINTTERLDTLQEIYGLVEVVDGTRVMFWSDNPQSPAIMVDTGLSTYRRVGVRGVPWGKPFSVYASTATDVGFYVFGLEFVVRDNDGRIAASSSIIRSCCNGVVSPVSGGGGVTNYTWITSDIFGYSQVGLTEFRIGAGLYKDGPRVKQMRSRTDDRAGVWSPAPVRQLATWQDDYWTHVRVWRSKRINRLASSPDVEPRGDANTLYLIAEYACDNTTPGGVPIKAGSLDSDGMGIISGLDTITGATRSIEYDYAEIEAEDRLLPIASDRHSPTVAKASVCDMFRIPPIVSAATVRGRIVYAPHTDPVVLDGSRNPGDDDTVYATSSAGRAYSEMFQQSFVKIGSSDGGAITAVVTTPSELLVIKQNATYSILDNDLATQPARKMFDYGVLSHRHTASHDVGTLMYTSEGILGVARNGGFYPEVGGVDYSLGIPMGTPAKSQQLTSEIGRVCLLGLTNIDAKILTTAMADRTGWTYYSSLAAHHVHIPGTKVQVFSNYAPVLYQDSYEMQERDENYVTSGLDKRLLNSSLQSAVSWTNALYGINGAQDEVVELRYAAAEASWPTLATATTLDADLLTSNGGMDKDQSPAGQTPKQEGTIWELSCSGYSDLLADPSRVPTASKHSYWNYIYYPGTQTTTEWTRTRVYANALVLRFAGTGQMHTKNCKASVVVMRNPGGLESYRRQQVDWNNLTQYTGDISNLGIHDLETEPYTWS